MVAEDLCGDVYTPTVDSELLISLFMPACPPSPD